MNFEDWSLEELKAEYTKGDDGGWPSTLSPEEKIQLVEAIDDRDPEWLLDYTDWLQDAIVDVDTAMTPGASNARKYSEDQEAPGDETRR
jgi:hypothetical protein